MSGLPIDRPGTGICTAETERSETVEICHHSRADTDTRKDAPGKPAKNGRFARYDWPALADELQGLSELLAADGLGFELTGFNAAEFDALAVRLLDNSSEPDDAMPPPGADAVTRKGDIWVFNKKHRLPCNDSRTADMRGGIAAMCFSDPPYNFEIPVLVGRSRAKHRNFAMAGGEMSSAEFSSFLVDRQGGRGAWPTDLLATFAWTGDTRLR